MKQILGEARILSKNVGQLVELTKETVQLKSFKMPRNTG